MRCMISINEDAIVFVRCEAEWRRAPSTDDTSVGCSEKRLHGLGEGEVSTRVF